MKLKHTGLVAAIALAALLGGCETDTGLAERVREKGTVFAGLTPEQRSKIEQGMVEVGFTADMTYLALGHPRRIETKTLPEGRVALWSYETLRAPGSMHLLGYNNAGQAGRTRSSSQTSANAPRSSGGGSGPEPSVDALPDMVAETLHVLLLNDVVVRLQVER